MNPYSDSNWGPLLPSAILTVAGLVALLLEVAGARARRAVTPLSLLALAAAGAALYAVGATPFLPGDAVSAELGNDVLVLALAPAFLISALAALVLGSPYVARAGRARGEYQSLILFSVAGMFLLAQARDLLIFFIGLETLSIPLYVLAGFFTDQKRSVESAVKYFTTGAFSSAFVAFGMALAYGAGGTLSLAGLRAALTAAVEGGGGRVLLAGAALAFLLVGFGFKIALAPFHAWAGDVYQGAPTPITALLSVGSKAAGLAGLARLLVDVFPALPAWEGALAALAAATLVVGACVAMLQEDVKRLIAYSGISHAGFLAMALVAHQASGGAGTAGFASVSSSPALQALLFYVLAYSLMTTGAVAVIAVVEREYNRSTLILDYAGLAARRPGLAAVMLVCLLSLGGMPPLAGFIGKWLVFQVTVDAGLIWLAVLAALSSVVGFYYYLRVVMQMYLRPASDGAPELEEAPGPWMLAGAAALGSVVLGFLPTLVLDALVAAPTVAAWSP